MPPHTITKIISYFMHENADMTHLWWHTMSADVATENFLSLNFLCLATTPDAYTPHTHTRGRYGDTYRATSTYAPHTPSQPYRKFVVVSHLFDATVCRRYLTLYVRRNTWSHRASHFAVTITYKLMFERNDDDALCISHTTHCTRRKARARRVHTRTQVGIFAIHDRN